MLLYQNYRIPQQRKALLSPFNTPVVSRGLSTVKSYGNLIVAHLTCCENINSHFRLSGSHITYWLLFL